MHGLKQPSGTRDDLGTLGVMDVLADQNRVTQREFQAWWKVWCRPAISTS